MWCDRFQWLFGAPLRPRRPEPPRRPDPLQEQEGQRWFHEGWLLLDTERITGRGAADGLRARYKEFPHDTSFHASSLDQLTLHPRLLNFVASLLRAESPHDVRLVSSRLFHKQDQYKLTSCLDKQYSLVPAADEAEAVCIVLAHQDMQSFVSRRAEAAPGGGTALAVNEGQALVLRLDTSIRHVIPDSGRAHLIVYRKAACEWVSGDTFVRILASTDIIEKATPEQRSVLGFPKPGHPYWNCLNNLERALTWRYGIPVDAYDRGATPMRVPQQEPPGAAEAALEPPQELGGDGTPGNLLSQQQVQLWREYGALHVRGIWPDASALEELRDHVCQHGTTTFPSKMEALNEIVLHPQVLSVAAQLLGTSVDLVRVHQAMAVSTRPEDQPMHQDYLNNSLTTPGRCKEQWEPEPEEAAMIVYLHDHDGIDGGTAYVPGLRHTDSIRQFGAPEVQHLRAVELQAAYRQGSALIYTIGTWHRGRAVQRGRARQVIFLSFKAARAEWVGGDRGVGQPTALAFAELRERGFNVEAFLAGLTMEQRSVLGFPPVGSTYWSERTIEATRARYGYAFVVPYL